MLQRYHRDFFDADYFRYLLLFTLIDVVVAFAIADVCYAYFSDIAYIFFHDRNATSFHIQRSLDDRPAFTTLDRCRFHWCFTLPSLLPR